ncbi:MAG TPA: hypothetical protein VHU81_14285 [Thermoanaerobaculia bacterium]|jgi:hypothetical protein|nr:hypothetical protein [Thermoanaerobaculia bacterium]
MKLNKKSLAKVFGPAVVLATVLALPVQSLSADPGNGKGKGQTKQVVKQKTVVKKQTVQKHAAPKPTKQKVVVQPVVVQREVVRQPVVVQRQPVVVQRQTTRVYRDRPVSVYDNRYYEQRNTQFRQGRGGADRSVIAADGYLDDTGSCLILRGHQGQVYNLVGDTDGLNEGDHVRLLGQLLYQRDNRCGGQLMEIRQVQTLWADNNHRQTYYDHLRDGSFSGYSDRYGRYNDDDRYYNDRNNDRYDERSDDYGYDRDGRRQLIIREGRIYNSNSSCPVLEVGRDQFFLTGDLRGRGNGDRVKVTGFLENSSRCGGNAIRVEEITRR